MDKTLQNALIALYGSLGGDIAALTDVENIGYLISAIAMLGVGDNLKAALIKELPDIPEDDGTYALQLVVDDGESTLTWEAAT